ncbi:glycoside hydrolase superfamily [Phakopsora pachyrhizi]|uniref:mannan endo-1,4-beta-mannosidase n=1 Tax=Phakopsora pachyrhizi TaxID=170000 RepID=A0AAV0BIK5_PHAPC|nr:glycoside hydrolase superfamily [Phakopsora pachyrhizi]
MAMAAKYGVKIIFPIINQDYGDNTTDWVGNFNDLIRHRYNISSYGLAQASVDWFTDMNIRNDFKKIISKLLTRKNTFNGRIYGEDDTIFAWETGNEMNWANDNNTIHRRPAPGNWTVDIAEHIKSLSPNTLVMDGSFSRNPNETAWPEETLSSNAVDIVSYHIYNDPDIDIFHSLASQAKKFNKTLVIGEHGFYSDVAHYQKAYEIFDCPGALLWSIRSHNEIGGFSTHSEGLNIYSYHVPGWEQQTSTEFDTIEEPIVRLTYEASYKILNQDPPDHPIPSECYPFYATNSTHYGISWKGSAWAKYYEVWAVATEGGIFQRVARHIFDNVESGKLFVAIDSVNNRLEIPHRACRRTSRPLFKASLHYSPLIAFQSN